ncbi:MAG TPA: tRNA (guanosine(46)-N7)-methyltransferase TrmB [Flavipsychrobacter sp.]|nr:tRNA (guanosine(46)-N7)-methyltransferase TrmB [Flavipsychrobacter sp.]
MGHKKLLRFNAINSFSNVLQYPEKIKGEWHIFFKNNYPITLELACGRGEYSVELGRENKDHNYIGVDIKGNRMYVGAKTALDENLNNVGFLRIQIGQIADYFTPGEVSDIWIIFPDPFLRKPRIKNRLTHPRFLRLYQQILKPGGLVQLKTDSKELYDFTLETIAENGCSIRENIVDIYGQGKAAGALGIQTYYESLHLAEGRTIYFVSFSLPSEAIKVPERFEKNEEQVS